jgi:tRNA(Ile)-lysidine synthase
LAIKDKTPEQKIVDFIREQNLISAGDKLLVAVSGGADSVCLLHLLACHRDDLHIDLHAAHLNHQLRGNESDADATYVSDLARKLSVPATVERRDVASYKKGGSLEEAAREVRYEFLADVARKVDATKVVTGHTCDDHIETVLLHILRGSGTTGLRGLQSRSEFPYPEKSCRPELIRPLLEINRQETMAYCRQRRLAPRSDSSNESLSFLRNRVRLELLPLLRSYNPGIDRALLRLAGIAADDIFFIEQQASLSWQDLAQEDGDALYMDTSKMLAQPRAVQRQAFRKAIKQLRGSLKDVEADHIEAMLEFLCKPAGKRFHLPDGLTLSTEYGRLIMTKTPAAVCPLPPIKRPASINIPGETDLPGWRVRADVVEKSVSNDNGLTVSFDLDKVGKKLVVRRRRPGDRFQPLGMSQTKKLQDFMVDAKIPRLWRDRVPLVSSAKQILWVVGWRMDDRVKVTEKTKKVLRLQFERLI